MNAADLIIIGAVLLPALMGLWSGILKPVSGIGGLVLGVILAIQNSGEAATLLVEYLEGETVRRVVAFIGIVLAIAIASRLTSVLFKKLLSAMGLGWLDNAAGTLAGAILGIVLIGTAVYVLIATDFAPTRGALAGSKLAPDISRASLLSAETPWCSSTAVDPVGPCTDLRGVFSQLVGRHIPSEATNALGEDGGNLADLVNRALSGSPQELADIVGQQR